MALADYQVSYLGVTMGPASEYRIKSYDGFRSMPQLRISDYAKLKHHGAYSGVDVLEGRHVNMTMHIVGTSLADLDAQLLNLETALVPLLTGTSPLSFKLPNQITKRVNGRARKRVATQVPSYKNFHQEVTVQFFCPDPRIYDDVLTTTAIAAAGSATLTNAGNFESRPTLTITVPTSPVTITNAGDSSNFVKIATSTVGAIPATTVIDLQNRTIVDGSGVNRMDLLDSTSTWFTLVPGANAVSVTTGTLSVAWRSAWI
ncbi:MAG: hypothetical protein NVSMB4_00510 [Acidimicrobiales bacterium]